VTYGIHVRDHACTQSAPCDACWTHGLRVLAVVTGPVLGQPLLLLVQGTRLQDHLLQLKGGVTVEAAFLLGGREIFTKRTKDPHINRPVGVQRGPESHGK